LASPAGTGQDRGVTTEQRSPIDSALDLFVYAPVGLALTAMEELPKLAEKGRAQVQGQITIARMVGQFAVAQGRREIEKRLGANGRGAAGGEAKAGGKPGGTPSAPTTSRGSSPAGSGTRSELSEHRGNGTAPSQDVSDADGGYEKLSGRPDGPALGQTPAAGTGAISPTVPTPAGPSPDAADLAIPGYDSLSASQVVQRLAGLSRNELEAVGAYEAAHRARRTILTRVNQLKA
jgi:hypothetical protein